MWTVKDSINNLKFTIANNQIYLITQCIYEKMILNLLIYLI